MSVRFFALTTLSVASLVACGGAGGEPAVRLASAPYHEALTNPDEDLTIELCVTQLKLLGTDADGGGLDLEKRVGLVVMANDDSTATWTGLEEEVGAVIDELKVEVHRDPETCEGREHSVSFGEDSLTRDLELQFTIDGGLEVPEAGAVVLDLDPIVGAYDSARADGKFNNEEISSYMEGLRGRAEVEGD